VIIQRGEPLAPYYDVSTVDCTVGIVTSTQGRAPVLEHGGALP
jgi:hypothetical protein